jgi:hypothetical protein
MVMTRVARRATSAIASTALLLAATPAVARGQAFVPEKGDGTVSVIYQNNYAHDHYYTTTRVDVGQIQWQSLALDLSYGLTAKVALDVSLPFIASKYTGSNPHPSNLDDGTYHSTFQDFRFAVRYNVRTRHLALTPYAGTLVPSHDYQYYAHAAPGRRLREFQIGTYVAKLLDPAIPGGFIQARVAYGFAEEVLNIEHNRSMADLEVGYFITPRLRAFALGTGQITHGGVDLPTVGRLPIELRPYHDQIDRLNYLNVGAGGSMALTDSTDLFASFLTNVANRNGHALNRGINLGITWSFSRSHRRANSRLEEPHAESLVRCICQKGE